jgi:uncharacterized membrane protein
MNTINYYAKKYMKAGKDKMNEQMNGQIPYDDTKLMSAFAYFMCIVPLIAGAYKTSEYTKFHVNQGLILWIGYIAYAIALGIITGLFIWIPVLGWIIVGLCGLAGFAFPVFAIIGIVNAVKGVTTELPLIGKIQFIK